MKPIGIVERDDSEVRDKKALSRILLDTSLTEALEGLEEFSHLFIIFWMHETSEENRGKLKTHPKGSRDMPLVGVYATRTPSRRNPVGLTLVELEEIRENVLVVRGLDAFNGTPVIDIKPYDSWDSRINAVVPDWWNQL